MNNIFFSADTHIGHKNVLKYMPSRLYALEQDTKAHDKWLIDMLLPTIGQALETSRCDYATRTLPLHNV